MQDQASSGSPERSNPSAGIMVYRFSGGTLQVLLVHPGGPFWQRRDRGAWQIPKGQIEASENAADAARREAGEELGAILTGALIPLGQVRQAGGKDVTAFALEQDIEVSMIESNRFGLECPRRAAGTSPFRKSTRRGGSRSATPKR